MPPKKKGKKKEGGKKEVKEVKVDPEEAIRLQKVEIAKKLKRSLAQESSQKDAFQQEKEKINFHWIVRKKELEDLQAILRNKQRETQDLEEKHQVEIKIYKQRVKHLLFEQQNELTKVKTDNVESLKIAEKGTLEEEADLKGDTRSLKIDLREAQLDHEDFMKTLKMEHDKGIMDLRKEFERKHRELYALYDHKMKMIREREDNERKDEVARIEAAKNGHIETLMRQHEQAFCDIKNYFNDITHNNLDLIKSLKEDVARTKADEQRDEKRMLEVAQENKRMSEPLARAKADVEKLKKDLEAYEKDKDVLLHIKNRILELEDAVRSLEWEEEVLSQRLSTVKEEREELRKGFAESVFDVQQKTGFKNMLLSKKMERLQEQVEHRDAQLNEVLVAANLDSSVMGRFNQKIEDIVELKNTKVRRLQVEVERLRRTCSEVLKQYHKKLAEFGIPPEELGFEINVPEPSADIQSALDV